MLTIVLFVDEEHRDTMRRFVVPRVGETIVIDCGEMVNVTEVNHDWDDPNFVQVNSVKFEVEEAEG